MVENSARLRTHKFTQFLGSRIKLESKFLYYKLHNSLSAHILRSKNDVRICFQWLKTVRVCARTNSHSFKLLE